MSLTRRVVDRILLAQEPGLQVFEYSPLLAQSCVALFYLAVSGRQSELLFVFMGEAGGRDARCAIRYGGEIFDCCCRYTLLKLHQLVHYCSG